VPRYAVSHISPDAIAAFRRMQQLDCCCDPDPHSPICKPCNAYWKQHEILEAEFGFRASPIVEPPGSGPLSAAERRYLIMEEACGGDQ
jgi:hypothetical protein